MIIKYEDLKSTYPRMFWRNWDLKMITKKFNKLSSGIKSIVNYYGREMMISPLEIKIEDGGMNIRTNSLQEAFMILPTKSQQREGLKEVLCKIKTSDNKVRAKLHYLPVKRHCFENGSSRMDYCVEADIHVEGFTERNKEEYNRLYNILYNG